MRQTELFWSEQAAAPERPNSKTQAHFVLTMLERQDWVCGSQFLSNYISRYSARIHDLRSLGWEIESKPCKDLTHHHQAPLFTFSIKHV